MYKFLQVLFLILFFMVSGSMLFADDDDPADIDDYFSIEEEETENGSQGGAEETVEQSGNSEAINLEALTTSPVKLSCSVGAGLGMGIGLIEWPYSSAADGREVSELLDFSGLYDTTATLKVDARPFSFLRFYAEVVTSMDEESLSFSRPYMDEIFIDYTFAERYFFRVGRQGITWGQGRLIDNPADLVDRASAGIAVRSSFPLLSGAFDGIIYILPAWVGSTSSINPASFAYAAQWEATVLSAVFNAAGHFKLNDPSFEDIGGSVSLSFCLGSLDMAFDVVGHWDRQNITWAPADWQVLGRMLWDDHFWSVIGEYMFTSTILDYAGHYASVAVKTPKVFNGKWQPAVRWRHAFQDGSGEIIPALSGTIAQKLTFSMGFPIVYGEPGTFYREALTYGVDNDDDDIDDEEYVIPIDNVIGLILTFRLSFSF